MVLSLLWVSLSLSARAATPLVTESWMMKQEASSFAESLLRPCLHTPGSSLNTGGERISVNETPACVSQMQAFSRYWESLTNVQVATHHASDATKLEEYKIAIEKKWGKQVTILPMMEACSCLVLSGPDAQYAAASLSDPNGTRSSLGTRLRAIAPD